jgi:hypothetical protein
VYLVQENLLAAGDIKVDSTHAYYSDFNGGNGLIKKAPLGGGASVQLASNQFMPHPSEKLRPSCGSAIGAPSPSTFDWFGTILFRLR